MAATSDAARHPRGEKTFGPPSVDGRLRIHHEEHEEAGFSFLSFVSFVSFVVKDRSNISDIPLEPGDFYSGSSQ